MKRSYLFLVLILTTLFSALPIGQARAMEDYSDNYWTLDEVLALREEAKREIMGYCEHNEEPDCIERYHVEVLYGSENNYQAVNRVNIFRLLITAVNPTKNTIRVLFIDDDMEHYYVTGKLENDNLNGLIMAWFDQGYFGYDFYNRYHNDTLSEETHLLLAKDNIATSFPPEEEVEFELEGNIIENESNTIYYYYITENGYERMYPANYNSCINHPNYQVGMECRLFFEKDASGSPVYLPVEVATTQEVEPEETAELEKELIPLAPNTGVGTTCNRQIELPWWMIGLIAAGEIITIYCLLPNFKKYRQKHQKI